MVCLSDLYIEMDEGREVSLASLLRLATKQTNASIKKHISDIEKKAQENGTEPDYGFIKAMMTSDIDANPNINPYDPSIGIVYAD